MLVILPPVLFFVLVPVTVGTDFTVIVLRLLLRFFLLCDWISFDSVLSSAGASVAVWDAFADLDVLP